MKYSCLFYSEGGRDKKFLMSLVDLSKFKYHTKKWNITIDNASGSSPKIILERCKKIISNIPYDLVVCFIDLDKLKTDHPRIWAKEKQRLEKKFSDIKIIWQIENAEDEYRKVLSELDHVCGKCRLNNLARKEIKKFINSDFWKRILEPIKAKEQSLDKN